MALNYAKLFNRRATPQSRPIPGSKQVPNSAGGYAWTVDDWMRFDRFLILGAEGGTYYIAERDLVKQNHDAIVRCIKQDGVRAVYGIRTFDSYTSHSFLYVLGNKGVTLAANILFNVYIHDLMTCHKAIDTELFRSLPLRASGFGIEPEITSRLLQRGERIYEVSVHYRARGSDEGKKLTALDGVRVLWTLLRCRLTPL